MGPRTRSLHILREHRAGSPRAWTLPPMLGTDRVATPLRNDRSCRARLARPVRTASVALTPALSSFSPQARRIEAWWCGLCAVACGHFYA